ncbi:MAG: acyl-CoA dehydrogenase, partial [Pseudomonadota bacterium]
MDGSAANTIDKSPILADLLSCMADAMAALETYGAAVKSKAGETLAPDGKPDRAAFAKHQHQAHGLAWVMTYIETLRETANWANRLNDEGKFGEIEQLLSQILFSKYLADLVGGIALNQGETIRPHELGTLDAVETLFQIPSVKRLILEGLTPASSAAAAAYLPDALGRVTVENTGLDETMDMVRDQFRKFANDKVL